MNVFSIALKDNIKGIEKRMLLFFFLFLIICLFLFPVSINAEEGVRSTSLHIISTEDGNIERVDYVNEDGEITDAADKHYATIIKTKNENTVLEEFFHADGSPAIQSSGHYALLREYNEKNQNYKITYLGIDGNPIMNKSGYSIKICSFNENGKVEREMYYDTENTPVETPRSAFGCCKKYNEQGRNICTIYLNSDYEPCMCGQGFAILRRNYYETEKFAGKVKEEYYYDQNDEPICLANGQYGVYHEYDDFGRIITLTYLGADGLPIVTRGGYSTIKRTFYEDDSLKTVRYYGPDGLPVCLSDGQYGYRIEDGKKIFTDLEGNDLFNLKNHLYNHQSSVIIICVIVVLVSVFCSKRINKVFLALYIVFIFYMTLLGRERGFTISKFDLFWSYKQFFVNSELRWEIINNILLFIPLGTILHKIYPKWRIILAAILLSVLIEMTQLVTATGWCELDDIFSNGVGALFGFVVGCIILNNRKRNSIS